MTTYPITFTVWKCDGAHERKWLNISSGVPLSSILGPLLFNIFLNDFFKCIKEAEVCNFADNNSLHANDPSAIKVKSLLEKELTNALHWFKINPMAANLEKFQIIFFDINDQEIVLQSDHF